jgi:hypothetical protein
MRSCPNRVELFSFCFPWYPPTTANPTPRDPLLSHTPALHRGQMKTVQKANWSYNSHSQNPNWGTYSIGERTTNWEFSRMVDSFPSETAFSRILNLITQTQKCQVQIWNKIWHEGHQWKFSISPWFYFHCQYNHVEVTIMLLMLYYEVRYDMKDINGSLAWSLILLPLPIQSCWGYNNVAHVVLWSKRYDMKDINGSLAWSLILLLPLQI